MRQAGEVTYADAHKQRRNEGYVKKILMTFNATIPHIHFRLSILQCG